MGQVGFAVLLITVAVLTMKTVKSQRNPATSCEDIICEEGKTCVIDGNGPPQCICPEDCSDAYVPVCTSYWIEFNNTCEMHKFACAHQINVNIHHFGKCNEKAADGSDVKAAICEGLDNVVQFPQRYVEWMHVARERTKDGNFQLSKRIDDMNRNQQLELVRWEFSRRDQTKDGKLDENETNLMLEQLVFETCTYGFLNSCDLNKKDGISLAEWLKCLKLA